MVIALWFCNTIALELLRLQEKFLDENVAYLSDIIESQMFRCISSNKQVISKKMRSGESVAADCDLRSLVTLRSFDNNKHLMCVATLYKIKVFIDLINK